MSNELNRAAPVAQLDADLPPPVWGVVETVGDMVRNLLTLDQSLPIHAAFHVDIAGERRCRTKPVTISRERVIEGKWVDPNRKDVPYAVIVWAKQDERIDGRTAGTAPAKLAEWAALSEETDEDWSEGYEAARAYVRMQLAAAPSTQEGAKP